MWYGAWRRERWPLLTLGGKGGFARRYGTVEILKGQWRLAARGKCVRRWREWRLAAWWIRPSVTV